MDARPSATVGARRRFAEARLSDDAVSPIDRLEDLPTSRPATSLPCFRWHYGWLIILPSCSQAMMEMFS